MKPEENSRLYNIRHSLSHLLAQAVLDMFPDAKLGTGPVTENGFYYDFELPRTLIPEDLPLLEKRMKKYVKQGQKFVPREEPVDKSIEFLEKIGQPFKVELVKKFVEQQGIKNVYYYENFPFHGDQPVFVDLCEGGHVADTKEIDRQAFRLTHISSAYWQADENNASMQRIYGVAFETAKELEDYEKMVEEAKKRDHRKLGTELELFMFHEEVGAGLPLWLPKGAYLRHKVMEFAFNTYLEQGYDPVCTPHIAHSSLWQHSGHLDFYGENMYGAVTIDEDEYLLKPMNCPLHVTMYNTKPRSYRELPIRWAEMGTVYRYERSGVLHGLTRVRGFTQDDAHIICRPDQLKDELARSLELTIYILKTFGFDNFEVNVSVRDPENKEKFIGDDQRWEEAEKTLKEVLEESGFSDHVYDIGGAVFYGPKIDVKVADSLGRKWQLSTIQFDFNLPERFGMIYIGEDGKEHTPYMIHRAILGSLERFIGVLIEHFGGAFPPWLAPVQAHVLPVAEAHLKYAEEVIAKLKENNIRVELSDPSETLGKRIRNSEKLKIPYMLIVGDKEKKDKKVNVRSHKTGKQKNLKLNSFVKNIVKEIEERIL